MDDKLRDAFYLVWYSDLLNSQGEIVEHFNSLRVLRPAKLGDGHLLELADGHLLVTLPVLTIAELEGEHALQHGRGILQLPLLLQNTSRHNMFPFKPGTKG